VTEYKNAFLIVTSIHFFPFYNKRGVKNVPLYLFHVRQCLCLIAFSQSFLIVVVVVAVVVVPFISRDVDDVKSLLSFVSLLVLLFSLFAMTSS
jgi:hypothetical protein